MVLFAFNSLLFCWIALPFSFVSRVRTSTVNQYVQSFPKGYPIPVISSSVEAAVISDSSEIPIEGYANFYSKKITIQDHIITPTLNKDYEIFYSDHKLRKLMDGYPLAWLNDTLVKETPDSIPGNKKFSIYQPGMKKPPVIPLNSNGNILITGFTPNSFKFSINSSSPAFISIFQQYNHNWKAKVNGSVVPVLKMNIAFMGVQVPPGESTLEFVYKPAKVITAIWLSLTALFIISLIYIVIAVKTKRL